MSLPEWKKESAGFLKTFPKALTSPLKRVNLLKFAPIAQLDRASDFESEGQEFESPWGHHPFSKLVKPAFLVKQASLRSVAILGFSFLLSFWLKARENNRPGKYQVVLSGSSDRGSYSSLQPSRFCHREWIPYPGKRSHCSGVSKLPCPDLEPLEH
jgi:hypothetical protein